MQQPLALMKIVKSGLRRSFISLFAIVLFSFGLITPALATGVYDLPSPNTEDIWVVDQAKEISLATQNTLSGKFKDLAKATGQEIRMVAIRRLDYGETIDSFADEVFTSWYPNEESQANQTLLVMDTLTNTTAIRRGPQSATMLTQDVSQSIVDETVGYNLRVGNKYNQALKDSGDRLVAVLSGLEDPGPPEIEENIQAEGTFTKAEDTNAGQAFTWVIVLLILATVIPMVTYFWYVL